MPGAGAAPHCPAGHFSPYSDGEKEACADGFANLRSRKKGAGVAVSPFSPFLRGEGAGRQMRGGAAGQ
ncbi:hypothetical protein EN786_25880 [Mesorhizobium sp. M4B.F.Ca.ET.143.01.1.1]|nr:hypothetical protein EOA31_23295 [Mesorhizobium sp. M4B.F.Ca.ET.049.02.1.2]TGV23388.1 hypothetical protein EN786_25880 [Mesorhizobium sp. M4B.F.Ca.ET.143.01.1.1]